MPIVLSRFDRSIACVKLSSAIDALLKRRTQRILPIAIAIQLGHYIASRM